LFIVALYFIGVATFFCLAGFICYTFYLSNSISHNQTVIEECIDKAVIKRVKNDVAEAIINYQVAELKENPENISNPFRIITGEEKEDKNQ
jgi:signal recognition particle subunit SEC65